MTLRPEDNLTVIVPTFNEQPNLERLFSEFAQLRRRWAVPFEILVVDDSSPDGTADAVRRLSAELGLPTRVLTRPAKFGLGAAVVDGMRNTNARFLCVMDADLSHPPAILPSLFDQLNGFDGVVASRYLAQSSVVSWPLGRKVISRVATALARPLLRTPCSDPLSGYFLFRRSGVEGVTFTGLAGKPLFEILAQRALTVFDVPYEFQNRKDGESKLSLKEIFEFVRLLASMLGLNRQRRMEAFQSEPVSGRTQKESEP